MIRMVQSSLADRLSSRSFWNAEKAIIFRKLESASSPEVWATKSKGADLPQSRRLTLQSQFSQGESMNEEILKSSRTARVAEILQ